jgi:transglutaminase-like putative cysteine protease
MAVVCGTLAGAFFVALPRLDGGYLGHREGGRRFPDDVSLGGEGLVNDQGSEVMRVRVTTKEGTPLPGPFHFRGRSLERFDGHTWTAGAEVDRAKGRQWDVEQQVQTTGPAELLFGVPDVVDVKGVSARLDPGSAWLARSPGRSLTYTVRSRNVPFGELRGADEPRWLQLPEDLDRRVYPLAWSIQPDEEDPERIARALTEWLGATYGYEEAPGDPVGDPLAWFLFDHKAGHCEYFATALTVMLRARGVPARLATGFYSEEVDGEWIVVREGNAHAWVEVPVAGGWATLDPTPASGLPQVDAASLQAQLDEWMARWYQDVVEYDMNAQFAAYGAIGKRFIFATGGSVPEGSMRAGLLGMILVGGALGFTLITGRILLNRLGGPSVRGPSDPVARLAADARRRLRRRGWTVPSELPLLEAAAWLRTRVGDEAAPLERFAELAYRARYGGVAVPLAELRACVSALSSIRRPTGRG